MSYRSSRRAYLGTLVTLPLAGCSQSSSTSTNDSPTQTETDSRAATFTPPPPTPEKPTTLSTVSVRSYVRAVERRQVYAALYQRSVTHIDVEVSVAVHEEMDDGFYVVARSGGSSGGGGAADILEPSSLTLYYVSGARTVRFSDPEPVERSLVVGEAGTATPSSLPLLDLRLFNVDEAAHDVSVAIQWNGSDATPVTERTIPAESGLETLYPELRIVPGSYEFGIALDGDVVATRAVRVGTDWTQVLAGYVTPDEEVLVDTWPFARP